MALQDDVDILTQEIQARYPTVNTAFDGDPNTAVEPEVVNAPLGAIYHEPTADRFWRKDGAGAWAIVGTGAGGSEAGLTLYVDPVGGDDGNEGFTQATAIQTLNEARKRTPWLPRSYTVQLLAGDHELFDHDTDNGGTDTTSFVVGSTGLTIRGTRSVRKTVTTTAVDPNGYEITVSDALTPAELEGSFYVDDTSFPGFVLRGWCTHHTDGAGPNTINIAWMTAGLGGFYPVVPLGATEFHQLDSRIIPPAVNPNSFANRFFYIGPIAFEEIDFDGLGLGFHGPGASTGGYGLAFDLESFTGCRVRNWGGTGLLNTRAATISASYFHDNNVGCLGSFITGNSYFRNNLVAISGEALLGAANVQWSAGNFMFNNVGEGGHTTDFTAYHWIKNNPFGIADAFSPAHHARCDGFSNYNKKQQPLRLIGDQTLDRPFGLQFTGGNRMDLFDSPNADLNGGTNYVEFFAFGPFPALSISLADWNDADIYDRLVTKDPDQVVWG